MEILKEKPLTLQETKESLDLIKSRDKEINFRSKKVEEYLNIIQKNRKPMPNLKEDLQKLDIQRLKENHIVKIINILPKNLDSLRAILAGENLTLKQEDLTKILETVKKHASKK